MVIRIDTPDFKLLKRIFKELKLYFTAYSIGKNYKKKEVFLVFNNDPKTIKSLQGWLKKE